ncbi:hypothetical protein BDZ89DRAFT_1055279 [Hymenopellis radicata]|nr:hypothetical protein BDZ89DRAFT_1055279 [Hymenopellis radicata]
MTAGFRDVRKLDAVLLGAGGAVKPHIDHHHYERTHDDDKPTTTTRHHGNDQDTTKIHNHTPNPTLPCGNAVLLTTCQHYIDGRHAHTHEQTLAVLTGHVRSTVVSSYTSFAPAPPSSEPTTDSASSVASSSTLATTSASQDVGVERTQNKREQRRSSPYLQTSTRSAKPSPKSKPAPPQPWRSKFVDVATPLLPPSIFNWAAVMKWAGKKGLTGQNYEPWKGTHNGYCLPDPNAIVSAGKEEIIAGQLRLLCKLWDVLLYKAAERRKEMQDLVNACLRDGTRTGRLEMINFRIQPVKWRGRCVKLNWSPSDPLDPIVVRPILWEVALPRQCPVHSADGQGLDGW